VVLVKIPTAIRRSSLPFCREYEPEKNIWGVLGQRNSHHASFTRTDFYRYDNDRRTHEVRRWKDNLSLEGQPAAFVTPELNGKIHIFTGDPQGQRFTLRRYILAVQPFGDILHDVSPTKDYTGQVQALFKLLQHLSRFLLEQQSDESHS
jgi:hypothetical protein